MKQAEDLSTIVHTEKLLKTLKKWMEVCFKSDQISPVSEVLLKTFCRFEPKEKDYVDVCSCKCDETANYRNSGQWKILD
jgi:hypothetical protein